MRKDVKWKEMEICVKGNEEKIVKMEKMFFESEYKKTSEGVSLDCKDCGKFLHYKKELTDHIKRGHERIYNYKIFDKSFLESWKLDQPSTHEEIVPFKCDICEKDF